MTGHRQKKGSTSSVKIRNRVLGVLFALTLAGMFFALFCVIPLKREVTVEAGERLDTDPALYFHVSDAGLPFLQLKDNYVDTSVVGDGLLRYSYLKLWEFEVPVHVVDTTPPTFLPVQDDVGIEPGVSLFARSLVMELRDNAEGSLAVSFADGEPNVSYDSYGKFENMLRVTDESGNVSESPVTIWVADAPQISAPAVFYVMESDEAYAEDDFLSVVGVTDVQDGERVRESLTADFSRVDTGKEGNYDLRLAATNSCYVTKTVHVPVRVVREEELTDSLLENGNAIISGAVLTKDTGNELPKLSVPDLQTVQELVKPTLVSIYYELENNGYAYGNGFVIDLTEDAVYIASNYHVLAAFESKAKLTFYHGFSTDEYTFLGGSEDDDVAFLKIDRSALPEEVFDYLREPKISLARAYTIGRGEELFRTSCFVTKQNHTEEGSFLSYEEKIFNGDIYTTFTVFMEQGDSGSAVYDGHGFLISMCAGVAHEGNNSLMCGVQLHKIVSEYERCSGNKLYAF